MITCLGLLASAQEVSKFKIYTPTAGGIDPSPIITSFTSTQGLTIKWKGFGGPYEIEQCPGLGSSPWKKVGTVSNTNTFTVPLQGGIGFLRVKGGAPSYTGAETCLECHSGTHSQWLETRHASAFETLKEIKQEKNSACLACHTVGYGSSTGFKNEATTSYLAGVQCESCHGPAGDHADKPKDLSLRPVKTMSAMMCGGCHTDFHHPTYEEYETSKHAKVTPTPANYFVQYGKPRIESCGACHSGSARIAMVKGKALPSGPEAAEVSITCTVCHEPHAKTPYGNQLRNPTYSTQNFSYNTSTNTTFAAQYDAKLNLCGQCHNARGATWKDTSRYPHYSPQYNMLVGAGGVEVGTPAQSKHRDIQKQCTQCHTHRHPVENPTEENPVYTGHTFKPDMRSCAECHKTDAEALALKQKTQTDIHQRMAALKSLLDTWAETKAPEPLRTKYGKLGWEYNTVGHVSNPTGKAGIVGPTSAEQTVVPDNIKQARFNIYLVEQDGSFGVHNADYARYLIKVAEDKVKGELSVQALQPAEVLSRR